MQRFTLYEFIVKHKKEKKKNLHFIKYESNFDNFIIHTKLLEQINSFKYLGPFLISSIDEGETGDLHYETKCIFTANNYIEISI